MGCAAGATRLERESDIGLGDINQHLESDSEPAAEQGERPLFQYLVQADPVYE